jgi:DNA polymerase
MSESEYSDEDIKELVELALSAESNMFYPKSGLHVGFAESQAFETLAQSLQNKYAYSELASAFQDAREVIVSNKIDYDIKDLHTQILNCRKCKNLTPSPNMPMWNAKDPEIVFILDHPIYDRSTAEFLLSALKESGFSSSKVCLTYVNRCNYPKRKFESQEIFNCSSYLHYELQLMNPKLIVCMGAIPIASVFGTEMTIKDSRSKIMWLGTWPIMVTYSPMHVLKSGGSMSDMFMSDIQTAYNYVTKKDS